MSRVNGDKARYNRVRKQRIAQRQRNHEMLKNMPPQGKPASGAKAAEAKPGTVSQ